jgi:predicted nuclease with TOPRIM domain
LDSKVAELQLEVKELGIQKRALRRKNHNRKAMIKRRNNRISSLVGENSELKQMVPQ